MTLTDMPTAKLILKLQLAGPFPQPDLIDAIWEKWEEAEPLLLAMFAEAFDDKWEDADDPRWYRFIHAGKFLLSWQSLEALPTFAKLYSSDDGVMQDTLEWFEEELAHFGPPAIPYLEPIIGKDSGNEWHYGKGLSGSVLTKIATYYPETREEIAAIFRAQLPPLEAIPAEPDEMWGNWAAELGELADEASRDQIIGLAESGVFSDEFFGLQSYQQEMNRGYKPQKPPSRYDIREDYRNQYDHEQARLKRLEREQAEQRANRIRAAKPRTGLKVGRNEPCPCGSGKKYKKCHGRPGA